MANPFHVQGGRIPSTGDIPVWDAKINQWVPQDKLSRIPAVSENGTALSTSKIQVQADNVTSTGATGPYTINFPVAYSVAPIVVAWCGKDSFGNVIVLSLDTVATTSFSLDMHIATSGAAVNTGQVILVEWIAVGQ